MSTETKGTAPAAVDGTTVTVGYEGELSVEEKAAADRMWHYIQEQNAKAAEKVTDPSTRPTFGGATVATDADLKRFEPLRTETVRTAKGVKKVKTGGFLPPTSMSPLEREESLKGFNVNLFPKGGIENFSPYRWAMAIQQSYTPMGNQAFQKLAP